MATWCAACKKALPQLRRLREHFDPNDVAILAVPVDENDTRKKLTEYVEEYNPPYRLQLGLSANQIRSVKQSVNESLQTEAIPSTIVIPKCSCAAGSLTENPVACQ